MTRLLVLFVIQKVVHACGETGNFTVAPSTTPVSRDRGEVVVSALRLDCVVYLIEAGDDPNSWAHTADSTRIVPVVLALLLRGSCLSPLVLCETFIH